MVSNWCVSSGAKKVAIWLATGVLACSVANVAHAGTQRIRDYQSDYTVYDNGTVIDNQTGIMWMRCSLGQEWDEWENTCKGEPDEYTFQGLDLAERKINYQGYAGYNDWIAPHIEDLLTLVKCPFGTSSTKTIPSKSGSEKEVRHSCANTNSKNLAYNDKAFPKMTSKGYSQYWSSTESNNSWGYTISFSSGGLYFTSGKGGSYSVRLMRYTR